MGNLKVALIEGKGGSAVISVGFGGFWEATDVAERFLTAPVGSWPFLSRFAIGLVLVDIGGVGRTLRGCRRRLRGF